MQPPFLSLAGLSGFLAVAMGAFGAHGLKSRLPADLMTTYQTAVQYHFWHTLALLAVGILLTHSPAPSRLLRASGWLFAAGIGLFSGSLYLLALTDARWLGAITPVGGTAWLAAWLCLGLATCRRRTLPERTPSGVV